MPWDMADLLSVRGLLYTSAPARAPRRARAALPSFSSQMAHAGLPRAESLTLTAPHLVEKGWRGEPPDGRPPRAGVPGGLPGAG